MSIIKTNQEYIEITNLLFSKMIDYLKFKFNSQHISDNHQFIKIYDDFVISCHCCNNNALYIVNSVHYCWTHFYILSNK